MASSDLSFTLKDFGPRIDGDYSLDLASLTNYDYHVIKDVSGVVAGGLADAMGEGDQEVMVAFVAICLIREGVVTLQQAAKKPTGLLWTALPGQIIWNVEVDEDDAGGEAPDPGSSGPGSKPPSSGSSKDSSDKT